MTRIELLRKLAEGAVLHDALAPWGSVLAGGHLEEVGAPGTRRFISRTFLRELCDSELIAPQPRGQDLPAEYVLTERGHAVLRQARHQQTEQGKQQNARNRAPVPSVRDCHHEDGDTRSRMLPEVAFVFQPIVDPSRHKVISYEALLRGPNMEPARHVLYQVPPKQAFEFDDACILAAIGKAAELKLEGWIHVNAFGRPHEAALALFPRVAAAAAQAGIARDRIVFEVKVDEFLDHTAVLAQTASALRDWSFKFALSDFPLARSGINLLRRLHPDIVKLDEILVCSSLAHPQRCHNMALLIEACQHQGTRLVGQRVESLDGYRRLQAAGIEWFQGNLFSAPALNPAGSVHFPD